MLAVLPNLTSSFCWRDCAPLFVQRRNLKGVLFQFHKVQQSVVKYEGKIDIFWWSSWINHNKLYPQLRSQCINPENEATQTVHVPVSSVKDASTQTEPDSNPSPASQSPRRPNVSARASPYTVPPRKEPAISTQPRAAPTACCNCQVRQLAYQPLPVYMMAAPAVLMPTFGYYLQGFPAPFAPGQLVLLPVSQPAPGRNN